MRKNKLEEAGRSHSVIIFTSSFNSRFLQVGNKLGEGQYGHVYKAIVVHDNARWPVALKRIKKEGCTPEEVRKQQEDLLTEGSIMASIEYHDNIANLQV